MRDNNQPAPVPVYAKGIAWMDNQLVPISEAKISVMDWGLTRSDITYDVVHVWQGSFFRLPDYLERFARSREKLRLDIGITTDEIKQILHRMLATSGLREAYVAMVASRGVPGVPGSRDPRDCVNHFYAWAVPWIWVIPPKVAERGAHLHLSEQHRRIPVNSVDPTVKNYHWGDMTAALFTALDAGFDTSVLADHQGLITEGPGFNLFAVIDGGVYTPKSGALEGITRKTVLEIAESLGLPHGPRDISVEAFYQASEVFTATTAGGPAPVTKVNDHVYGDGNVGPVTKKILETYWQWHQRDELIDPIVYG